MMNEVVHAIVLQHGRLGLGRARHRRAQARRPACEVKDSVALELMRTMKKTLDPNNILNPGKVLSMRVLAIAAITDADVDGDRGAVAALAN